ncbi:hypothetical protein ACW9H6_17065 [Pseudomonas sp. SDO528_S397]
MNKTFYRADQRLPLSPSNSLAPGLVKISGTVVLRQTRLSPVDGVPCAGYRLSIEQYIGSDPGDRMQWQTVFSDAQCIDFAVKDAHGTVDICAEGIELMSGEVPEWGRYRPTAGPNRQQGEVLLDEGLAVVVIGTAVRRHGKTVIARGEHPGSVFGVERLRTVQNWQVGLPAWRMLGLCALLVVAFSIALLSIGPAQWAQWRLPSRETFQQMAAWGPAYEWAALLYQRPGPTLALMAVFGGLLISVGLMGLARVLLYKDIHRAVQPVLVAWAGIGAVTGGLVVWALLALAVDPFKVLLIWLSVMLALLVFCATQQRALRALLASIFR